MAAAEDEDAHWRHARAQRGSPSTRWAMMLRCASEVPAKIVAARGGDWTRTRTAYVIVDKNEIGPPPGNIRLTYLLRLSVC